MISKEEKAKDWQERQELKVQTYKAEIETIETKISKLNERKKLLEELILKAGRKTNPFLQKESSTEGSTAVE